MENLCIAAAYRPVQELLEDEKKAGGVTSTRPSIRPLKLEDFIKAKAKVSPSVAYDATSMNELRNWTPTSIFSAWRLLTLNGCGSHISTLNRAPCLDADEEEEEAGGSPVRCRVRRNLKIEALQVVSSFNFLKS
ncbi:hypothetical protein FCM35_KLT06470 [Carex littledalei]|uniref:Uncharacterized protein n=1 Tax=Carex littledalei TaxID=544730 RepID=A0A833QRG1_9POAL|nr:hypothetical protein FCM35_KLT06470 [Carex littledalei]